MFTWLIHIGMTNWLVLVLKGDSMVRHHMGPNRMHPDRSSCLGLSANGWMSQDQVFCTFSEQMLRSVYCTVHALGLVLLNTRFWVSSLRKPESVLGNTLGKVRSTWRVKIKYITFKNWIMSLYIDERRGVQENTSMRSREFPRAQPEGTPKTECGYFPLSNF